MKPIDKVALILIENRKLLFARSHGKDVFFNPGGKREGNETDQETLIREMKEELGIDIIPETIQYVETFRAQAVGKPEGQMVEIKCYKADHRGELKPANEIEELAWFTSKDVDRTSPTGVITINWLKERNLID